MLHPTNSHDTEERTSSVNPISSSQPATTQTDIVDFGASDGTVRAHDSSHQEDGANNTLHTKPWGVQRRVEASNVQRPVSYVEEEEAVPPVAKERKDSPVTWMSLPKKDQLAILTLARLAEPLTERGMQAYMFYQLKSFNTALPDEKISSQGGLLASSYAMAQFCTAVLWGKAADSPRFGRKRVLIIGLSGTLISCLGIGFARSFYQAMFFRALGGGMNGNVGVMRTMISEIIKEKKFQSRAFLLLPMCFNIGVIIGPIVGGFLADPINSLPGLMGPGSIFGGKEGVGWMKTFPYALPQLFSMLLIVGALLGVVFGLDETHHSIKHQSDWGRQIGKRLAHMFSRKHQYSPLYSHYDSADPDSIDLENIRPVPQASNQSSEGTSSKISYRRIYTPNVVLTLALHFLLALHISSFNALIFILLPAPRAPHPPPRPHNLLRFTGGLGLSSSRVGLATAIIGFIGFPLQLFLYPKFHAKFGTLKCYRIFLPFSSMAYTSVPYLVLLPNIVYVVWPCLTFVLSLQVISRTFALPGAIILINNSCPDPRVLGTIHGVAQSVSSAARSLGPLVGGWALGQGLKNNMVGAVWWAMAIAALIGWCVSFLVFEGSGNEVEEEGKTEAVDTAVDHRVINTEPSSYGEDSDDEDRTHDEERPLMASQSVPSGISVDVREPRRTAPQRSVSNMPDA